MKPKQLLATALFLIFAVLYLLAIALFIIGTFGLFGQRPGPLAGVFLVPLGLPWNLAANVFPDSLGVWLLVAAPAVNISLLWWLARRYSHAGRGNSSAPNA